MVPDAALELLTQQRRLVLRDVHQGHDAGRDQGEDGHQNELSSNARRGHCEQRIHLDALRCGFSTQSLTINIGRGIDPA